jgi:hypothetical protein
MRFRQKPLIEKWLIEEKLSLAVPEDTTLDRLAAAFGFVLAIMIVRVLLPFVNCYPFSRTLNLQGPCSCAIAGLSLWRYLGILNIFATLIIVAIPVPALVRLHVS